MFVDKSDTEIIADIKIDVHHIDPVKKFCHLGSQITNDNKSIVDVKKRIKLAKLAFGKKRNQLVN